MKTKLVSLVIVCLLAANFVLAQSDFDFPTEDERIEFYSSIPPIPLDGFNCTDSDGWSPSTEGFVQAGFATYEDFCVPAGTGGGISHYLIEMGCTQDHVVFEFVQCPSNICGMNGPAVCNVVCDDPETEAITEVCTDQQFISDVPEFSWFAAVIAVTGAGLIFLALRRR